MNNNFYLDFCKKFPKLYDKDIIEDNVNSIIDFLNIKRNRYVYKFLKKKIFNEDLNSSDLIIIKLIEYSNIYWDVLLEYSFDYKKKYDFLLGTKIVDAFSLPSNSKILYIFNQNNYLKINSFFEESIFLMDQEDINNILYDNLKKKKNNLILDLRKKDKIEPWIIHGERVDNRSFYNKLINSLNS